MAAVLLQRGRVDEAREHALWALRSRPSAPQTLQLMAAIKARKSPFWGLWWRLNVWMAQLGEKGTVLVLLGSYLVYRAAVIILQGDSGESEAADVLQYVWIAIIAWSWLAPLWFSRLMRRELSSVRLRREF